MSYLALARKWRPAQFNQVVGQSHVLTALGNALAQNRLHHAYLFSGTRGVGKTSIGRLFAKGLNCETGITATPCGQCTSCREIEEGRFVDLLEIDAASRTKVEDTRELLDNVQYKPARGRFKVYLIDEVHMLSRHSFNALLKTLEEPPEYVKFLLATTDPQKLPVTILSRCLQFHLKPISVDQIHEQLDYILKQEKVDVEQRALGMISHAADGSMRDALSLTDQAIALGNGLVSSAIVSAMLGVLDADQAIHLLEAIASKQTESAVQALNQLAQNGVEWDNLLQELTRQLHRVALYQALPASLDKTKSDAEKIEHLAQVLTPQDVQLFYQIALTGRKDLPYAPTGRMGIEMTVLRMMAFCPIKADVASHIELPEPMSKRESSPVKETPAISVAQSVPPQEAHIRPQQEQPPLPNEGDYPPEPEDDVTTPYHGAFDRQHTSEPTTSPSREKAQQGGQGGESTASAPRALGGLRHQLRSKRAQAGRDLVGENRSPKKSSVATATSVIERVTSQHTGATAIPSTLPSHESQEEEGESEPYQWKPLTQAFDEEKAELTPTQIKQALEHAKTPEMMEKLISESIKMDEWAALVAKLDVAKLVEQLALNSAYRKEGSNISLYLRPSFAHLNSDKAQNELLQAVCHALDETCHLTVELGEQGQTPMELRESLYNTKLEAAHKALESDSNVQFIQKRFAAQLDKESVRPI